MDFGDPADSAAVGAAGSDLSADERGHYSTVSDDTRRDPGDAVFHQQPGCGSRCAGQHLCVDSVGGSAGNDPGCRIAQYSDRPGSLEHRQKSQRPGCGRRSGSIGKRGGCVAAAGAAGSGAEFQPGLVLLRDRLDSDAQSGVGQLNPGV